MRNLVLSTQRLNKLQECPRKYYFAHILNRVPIEKPKYFIEGEFIHILLEIYYHQRKLGQFNLEGILDSGRNKATEIDGLDSETTELMINVFKEYILFHTDQNWTIQEVETPFAKVLWEDEKLDLRIIIQGLADLLINVQGIDIIVDHKKVGRNTQPYPRDNQILSYCWAFNRRDFIINQLGTQKTLAPKDRFRRHYFNITGFQIDEWIEETIYNAFEAIKYFENSYWPGRIKSCQGLGFRCSYYDICNSEKENWAYKLDENFKVAEDYDIMGENE